jgi:hydroxymethylbilane synthase
MSAAMLRTIEPTVQLDVCVIRTHGDADRRSPLQDIGGLGVFTAELERSLVDGEIDLAVHSLKDLPLSATTGITTAAICARDDPRDVLISRGGPGVRELQAGAVVGTSSTRREAQLLALRSDLTVRQIRGNVDTRIGKVMAGEYDAVILAAAGVLRLGLAEHITEFLSLESFVPAPGQAALAVQCRSDDDAVRSIAARIDDPAVSTMTDAERMFLGGLGGGCSLPVAAIAQLEGDIVELNGWVGARDGSQAIRVHGACGFNSDAARALGARLAQDALTAGAGAVLS